jgi:hypothetical protein
MEWLRRDALGTDVIEEASARGFELEERPLKLQWVTRGGAATTPAIRCFLTEREAARVANAPGGDDGGSTCPGWWE